MDIKQSFTSTVKTLADGIENYINERLKSASFDVTRQGIITEILDNNQYIVKVKGTAYAVPSCISDNLQVNDTVLILVVQNDIKNSYIIGKKGIQKGGGGSSDGDMLKAIYDVNNNNKIDNAENADKVNGYTVEKSVPANAIFTDTVYVHPSGTNPHNTTKSDVDLGNVTNESKSTMFSSPIFTGTAKATGNTNYTVAQLRNIILSTSAPTSSDGDNGDIWIIYS